MRNMQWIVMALALVGTNAFAMGYGSAGCGLGSIVIGSGHGISQIFAATTNGTSASQTFGITTGTSNCGGGGTSPTSVQYIEANRVSLSNDISRGNGEVLGGLAEVMGCTNKANLAQTLRTNYAKVYPTQNVDAKSIDSSIRKIIQETPALKSSCSLG